MTLRGSKIKEKSLSHQTIILRPKTERGGQHPRGLTLVQGVRVQTKSETSDRKVRPVKVWGSEVGSGSVKFQTLGLR